MAPHTLENAPERDACATLGRCAALWFCLALGALLLAGCSYKTKVGEVERTDLSDVEHGVSRQGIEEDLGPPVAGTGHELGRLDIYPYDTGRHGKEVGITQDPLGFNPAYFVIFGLIVASEAIGAEGAQEGHLAVLYNKKQEAKWVWKGGRISTEQALKDAQAELEKLMANETIVCVAPDESLSMTDPHECLEGEGALATWRQAEEFELKARAHRGDAEAMYRYAIAKRGSEAWGWYCLSAHKGYAPSQRILGSHYLHGLEPVSKDLVRAYVWLSLSGTDVNWIESGELSPEELANAKRLLADWQPNPAECETIAAQAQAE